MAYGAILGQTGQGMLSNNKLVATITLQNYTWGTTTHVFTLPSGMTNANYAITLQATNDNIMDTETGGLYIGVSYNDSDIAICPNVIRVLSSSNSAPKYIELSQSTSQGQFAFTMTLSNGSMNLDRAILNIYQMT